MTIKEAENRWNDISMDIAKRKPYLAGVIIHRKASFSEDTVMLWFGRKERMLVRIAEVYMNDIRTEFKDITGLDIKIKIGVMPS